MSKFKDLVGHKYGKLLVIENTLRKNKNGNYIFKCVCDCGKYVDINGSSLIAKNTISCGCSRVRIKNLYEEIDNHVCIHIKNNTVFIDKEDLDKVKKHQWYIDYKGYVKRSDNLNMSNFLLNSDKLIDHKNGDILDNRKVNLRIVTKNQNAYNSKLNSLNTTGFKGVSKRVRKTKTNYRAYITICGHQYNIGHFDTAEEAAEAYRKKSLELHGEYSVFNR